MPSSPKKASATPKKASAAKKISARSMRGPRGERQTERLTTLTAVILSAPYLGAEGAIDRFGPNLSALDKRAVRRVTQEEWRVLRSVKRKILPSPRFV